MAKPTLAKGMRDFSPQEIRYREYIFSTIKSAFTKYGFMPIETPAIENMEVLSGKYGEEGDKLLFKILNSGNFLEGVNEDLLSQKDYKKLSPAITEKGLRYDLTVPLARYVVMNRNDINFPFKRYHIDRVWRADRPQRGRYREFYQCDADIIGSYALLYDAECIALFDEVLSALNMSAFTIKINNRKILSGMAEEWGFTDKFTSFTIALDKWDKIGEEGVVRELGERGFSETQIHRMQQLFRIKGTHEEKLKTLDSWFLTSEVGKKGVAELREVLSFLSEITLHKAETELDFTLARGLDYYTSTIFEVVLKEVKMGSIASGGRYDELTATFGVPDMPGVGISFGAERIYDVMKELNLFPEMSPSSVKVLLINFGGKEEKSNFYMLHKIRQNNIAAEMYPSDAKIVKQITYAEKKGIPFILIAGEKEWETGQFQLKNLATREQVEVGLEELIIKLT
ncbi:MAG: histidine--tRNA ligase [Bacteroidetes bacterium]|nr:histidine--tRNA ligase [Bacteroidota bacterium]